MHESLRIGDGGYTVPWLHLTQLNVPTDYDLAGLSLGDFKQTMTNSADETPGVVSNVLSAASHVHVGSGAGSVPSVATRIIGSTGVEVTSILDSVSSASLQPRAD